jgi:geranylgeranyl pyrophosphate synthase
VKPKHHPAPAPTLVAALDEALSPAGAVALDREVPGPVWSAALAGPAAAFLARPGKDLRAMLVRAGFRLGGAPAGLDVPARLARVIEIVHAGSLIVDDVQDDSELRRGGPALHRMVGVPLAINTGSWMYFWALTELAQLAIPSALERAVRALERCHQGQALDLATRVVELDAREVASVVGATTRLKTGALCRLAAELGALAAAAAATGDTHATRGGCPRAAGEDAARVAAIGDLGEALGCALQMLDDLGCLVAPDRRDKAAEDLRGARPTWPWAWLAEQHDPFSWSRLVSQARLVAAGAEPGPLAEALAERVEGVGRARVRATLDAALAAARGTLASEPQREHVASAPESGAAAALDALAADLRRMEAMYG